MFDAPHLVAYAALIKAIAWSIKILKPRVPRPPAPPDDGLFRRMIAALTGWLMG